MTGPRMGIDEKPQQLRSPIIRGTGVTESEQHLARLSERSFLDLWSFPNVYRNQTVGGAHEGKEFCDLLVVCWPHVLIFSEKNIGWRNNSLEVAWSRWFRKAVKKAVDQIRGTERWLRDFPERIFLDSACKEIFPLQLPAPDVRITHRIVVARGAGEPCKRYFNGGTGSLILMPSVKGDAHWKGSSNGRPLPFTVGDVDPDGPFVHVLDDGSLDLVMNELDTITDFTDYLQRKAMLARSGGLAFAASEEDLVAYYLVNSDPQGFGGFGVSEETPDAGNDKLSVGEGHYEDLKSHPQYIAKKEADEVSYTWDALIKNFTEHMLGGTSIVPDGHEYDLKRSEEGVRLMALESRLERRGHGEAINGAMRQGLNADRFFRMMLPPSDNLGSGVGFFFLTMKFLEWMDGLGGYEKYRHIRSDMARTYAEAILMCYPYLNRVVGIAVEPPRQGQGASEDLVLAYQSDWTDEVKRRVEQDCEKYGIMQGNQTWRMWSGSTFPDVEGGFVGDRKTSAAATAYNREDRRALAAKQRKARTPRRK